MNRRTLIFAALLGLLALSACAPQVTNRTFLWNGQSFRTRLITPRERTSDITVMFIGGGYGFDLRWTTPGSYEVEGQRTDVTISGHSYHDGDTLAHALVDKGIAVYQWSSIAEDDSAGLTNPALARGWSYPDLRTLSRAALADLRALPDVTPDRIVIMGYSLGAARAAQLIDDGVVGVVLLSGAYVSPFLGSPRSNARGASELIADIDAGIMPLDAQLQGEPAPISLIASQKTPCLAVFGSLDPISIHAPLLEHLRDSGVLADIEIVVLPDLNHQLGRQSGPLTGPMDGEAVDRIIAWIVARFGTGRD